MIDRQAVIVFYKKNSHLWCAREKAIVESNLWADATNEERRLFPRRQLWIANVLDIPPEEESVRYHIYMRTTLWNAGSAAERFWPEVDKGMPLHTAVRLLSSARDLAAADKMSLVAAVNIVLAEYLALTPTPLSNGKVVYKNKPKARRRAVKVNPHAGAREVWGETKALLKEHIATRLTASPADVITRVVCEFEAEFNELREFVQGRIHKAGRRAADVVVLSTRVLRAKILRACEALAIDPPPVGKLVDMDKAKSKKRQLVRLYHPDIAGDTLRAKYEEVVDAYATCEQYNETLTKGEQKWKQLP